MENQSSYRIRTKLGETKPINIPVSLMQEYNSFEVLSLKINTDDTYRSYTSTEGIVVGRVSTANNGLGIPNVRVSIFVPKGSYEQTVEEMAIYPFSSPTDKDGDMVRYNLLPSESDFACYQVIGTLPSKRKILDNETICEVFDKYYKYTTVTNEAGDFMLTNIPVGKQRLHIDADLSDIGPFLSQKPYNMIENLGFEKNRFESTTQFKASKDLDSLVQVISQDKSVYVYPYWGDATENGSEMKITRTDLSLNYEFKTQAIFIGSVITDKSSNAIRQNCTATENNGKMSDIVTGPGRIEMIRKTVDNKVEQFKVKGDALINDNGVWCYAVPMNLDYVRTDEFGNIIPTDDPNKGVPTRARVRFRITLNEMQDDKDAYKRCSYLVPNNPKDTDEKFLHENEADYSFGSDTWDESFVDLLWNKVYTVKNFVPRFQKSTRPTNRKHTGIKMVNHFGDNNPFPYNSMSIKLPFVFRLICVIVNIFIGFVATINAIISIIGALPCVIAGIHIWKWYPFKSFLKFTPKCIAISPEFCDDGVNRVVTYPGCFGCVWDSKTKAECTEEQRKLSLNGEEQGVCLNKADMLKNCVQNQLAQQNEATSFNFGNDWINGCLYMPLWYRKIKPKKSFLFGLFRRKAKDEWCSGEKDSTVELKYAQFCAHSNTNTVLSKDFRDKPIVYHNARLNDGCKNECHKRSAFMKMDKGVIMNRKTMLGQTVWYYKSVEVGVGLERTNAIEYLDSEGKPKFTKLLYATDIILLGSLNDCDTNGIPKFFNYLKGTTYNMPSDILFTDTEISYEFDLQGNLLPQQVHSTSVASGCDWGNDNEYGKFDGGLFYSIGCSDIDVNAPSCINLKRICEIGVGLDEMKYVEDIVNSNITSDTQELNYFDNRFYLRPDGFVSYDDIIDFDYRSMFATLNGNNLKTKVNNTSGVREYDFRYLFIDNFDGSLHEFMYDRTKNYNGNVNYKGNFNLERPSKDYLLFRMGERPYFYDGESLVGQNSNPGPNVYRFPKFKNSFYFYFGLKEGKTAIDLFNQQYNEPCATQNEISPSIPYEVKGNSWCVQDGDVKSTYNHANYDGYLRLNLEDIAAPYSLIFNSVTNQGVSYSQSNITDGRICFCGTEGATNGYVRKTLIYEDYSGVKCGDCYMLNNGEYNLTIADNEGNYTSVVINVGAERLQFYDIETKFKQPNDVLLQKCKNYDEIAKKGIVTIKEVEGIPEVERKLDDVTIINGTITIYSIFQDGDYLDNFDIKVTSDDEELITSNFGTKTLNVRNKIIDGDTEYFYSDKPYYVFKCPKGDAYYSVKVIQCCKNGDDEWYQTQNFMEKRVFVPQPTQYKLYINNIDYDIIKNFKTGWALSEDADMQTRNGYGIKPFKPFSDKETNVANIKGWNDIGKICHASSDDDDKIYYDWSVDVKTYGPNELVAETDNITGFKDLTTYNNGREYFQGTDEEWNELANKVQFIKNRLEFLELIKEGLFIFCGNEMKTLTYQVITDDNPYDLWSMYNPEAILRNEESGDDEPDEDYEEEESSEYGDHVSESKGDGTKVDYKYVGTNENTIQDIMIPTLTYVDSKQYGNHTGNGLCFGQDNLAGELQGENYVNVKPPYLIACVNTMGISKPFGMTNPDFFVQKKNEFGLLQYSFGNGNKGCIRKGTVEFFGVHIIDKIMDCNFVCWSYIKDITLFLNNLAYDNAVYKEKGKYYTDEQRNITNTNGIVSFEIINGKTNDFVDIKDFKERSVFDEKVMVKTFDNCTEYSIPTRRYVLCGIPLNNQWVYDGNLKENVKVTSNGENVKEGYYEIEGKIVHINGDSIVDEVINKVDTEWKYDLTETTPNTDSYYLRRGTSVRYSNGNVVSEGYYQENDGIVIILKENVSRVGDVYRRVGYEWSYETPENGNMEGVNVKNSADGTNVANGYYRFNNVAFMVQYSVVIKQMNCYDDSQLYIEDLSIGSHIKWQSAEGKNLPSGEYVIHNGSEVVEYDSKATAMVYENDVTITELDGQTTVKDVEGTPIVDGTYKLTNVKVTIDGGKVAEYDSEATEKDYENEVTITKESDGQTTVKDSEGTPIANGTYKLTNAKVTINEVYYFVIINDKGVSYREKIETLHILQCDWKFDFPLNEGSIVTNNDNKNVQVNTSYVLNDELITVALTVKDNKSVVNSKTKVPNEITVNKNGFYYTNPLGVGSTFRKTDSTDAVNGVYAIHNVIVTVENSKVTAININDINISESIQQEVTIYYGDDTNPTTVRYADGRYIDDGVYTYGSEVWEIVDSKIDNRKHMSYVNYMYTTEGDVNQYVLVPNETGTFSFTDCEDNCTVSNILYGGMNIEFITNSSIAEDGNNTLFVNCVNGPMGVNYYIYKIQVDMVYPMNQFEMGDNGWYVDCGQNISPWKGTNATQIFNKNTTVGDLHALEDKSVEKKSFSVLGCQFTKLTNNPYFVVARTNNGCCTISNVYDFTTIKYCAGIVDYGFKKVLRIALIDIINDKKEPNNYYLTRYSFNGKFKPEEQKKFDINWRYGKEKATNFIEVTIEEDKDWLQSFLSQAKIGQWSIKDATSDKEKNYAYIKQTPIAQIEDIGIDKIMSKTEMEDVIKDYNNERYDGAWDALDKEDKGLVVDEDVPCILTFNNVVVYPGDRIFYIEDENDVYYKVTTEYKFVTQFPNILQDRWFSYMTEESKKLPIYIIKEVEEIAQEDIPEDGKRIDYDNWNTNDNTRHEYENKDYVKLSDDRKYRFIEQYNNGKYSKELDTKYSCNIEDNYYQNIECKQKDEGVEIVYGYGYDETSQKIDFGRYIIKWTKQHGSIFTGYTYETRRALLKYEPKLVWVESKIKTNDVLETPYFINYKEFDYNAMSNPSLTIEDKMGLNHICKFIDTECSSDEYWVKLICGEQIVWA